MSERKKPDARSLPVLMDAALAVYLHVGDHVDEPGDYGAISNIYFDALDTQNESGCICPDTP